MAVKTNEDGSVTVDLRFPIQLEGQETKAITLRRLKGKQFRKLDMRKLTNGDHMLQLIGQLGGLPPSSCDMLDAADITDLSEVITDFFGRSPETGEA